MEEKKNLNLFSRRHIGQTKDDIDYMLKTIGFSSMDSFIEEVIPKNILEKEKVSIGPQRDEESVLKIISCCLSSLPQQAIMDQAFRIYI